MSPNPFPRPDLGLPRGAGRVVVCALAGVLLLLLAAFASVTLLAPRSGASLLWDSAVYSAIMLAACGLVVARVVLVREERLAWGTLAAALGVYTAGDLLYTFVVANLDPEPYPSVSDALWLGFYVLAFLCLMPLIRREARDGSASVWVDGLIAGLGAATLTAALSFDTIVRSASEGAPLEVAVSLAYPLFDLVLLGAAVGAMAAQRWRGGIRWWLLGAGLLAFALGDTVYVFQSSMETYAEGGRLDVTWPAGAAALGLAAWTRRRPLADAAAPDGAAVLVAPLLFATAALGLLVHQHFQALSLVALLLAAATVLAALGRIALTVRDVAALADTHRQANTDELTGVANRRRLFEVLEHSAAESSRGPFALVLLDLDRFKEVNDALGHHAGDELLRRVVGRIAEVLRPGDLLSRLGGDEFAVVLPGADERAAFAVAERIDGALRPAFELDGASFSIGASSGIARFPEDAGDAEALVRHADEAMYRVKRERVGTDFHLAAP